jgi:outer membrane lipoprotein SlyB
MKGLLFSAIAITALLLSGCARQQGPTYEGRTYSQIKEVRDGEVIAHRYVIVKDEGGGTFIGALVGTVLGSTMGSGRGKRLTTVGGAILGGVIGSEAGKANAEELTVALDNGRTVVVVVKGDSRFLVGDRVRIIKDGNCAASVQRLPNR